MTGKNILVTGASQGIGEAVARHLSEQGAFVVMVARNDKKLIQIQKTLNNKSLICQYDLNDLDNIEKIFLRCKEEGIKLDGMVHCAGINKDMPIRSNDTEVMNEVMRVNYMSFVTLSKFFVRRKYSNDKSCVLAISSNATSTNAPGMCTYTSSKIALEATVKILAKETIKRQMRVNAIAPAWVNTEMIRNTENYVDAETIVNSQPLGIIPPVYIAYLVDFLMSEKSKYITGAVIPVSGGV